MEILSYLLGKKASGGGGGSGKFTYEEGTWTPTEDTLQGEISFARRHSKTPTFVSLIDIGTDANNDTLVCFEYIDFYQLHGETMTNRKSINSRGKCTTSCHYAMSTGTSGSLTLVTRGVDEIKETYDKTYARYYVDEEKFFPIASSTNKYLRADRLYKWIAIWVDE